MFDIGWGEFLVIGVVALIAIGPKELPAVLRTVGQWMTKLRRLAAEFQGQFHEAIREAEMADLKKEVEQMTEKAQSYANFDPLADIQKDIENTIADKPAEPSGTAAGSEPAADHGASASPAVAPEAPPAAAATPDTALPEPRPNGMTDAGAKPA